MTIPTLDLALAGMQPPRQIFKALTPTLVAGRAHSLWYLAGVPGPGSANTSTATGVARSSTSALVAGQIPFYDPGSGNSYLARFFGMNRIQASTMMLCDRLWDCGAQSSGSAISPTSTSAQTINSLTWPARDNAGSTNGDGVLIGLEVSSNQGAGAPTATVTYTNSAGTGSKTGTNTFAWVASSVAGAFYPIGLAAGDVGVRSVQTLTMSVSQTSGQLCMVAYRILDVIGIAGASVAAQHDILTGGFTQLYNGTVPFIVIVPNTTTACNVDASITVTQI